MKVLVSACLLGHNCKYSGGNNYDPILNELLKGHEIIPVCPEVMGGLSVPRISCEIIGDKVIGKDGNDYTYPYQLGAKKALEIAKKEKITLAILKKRSPSCGASLLYDVTFTKRLVIKDCIFERELKELNVLILEA